MAYKTDRSRKTDIPRKVKQAVMERDGGRCIFCGRMGYPNAHYIPRSKGGLGIEKNIVTACFECHERMDHTVDRKIYLDAARRYLMNNYDGWNEDDLIYRKERDL
jgi:5-methylcytosine-specific restriction endonuclease McrA